jgi:cell division protein FtsW
MEFRPNDSRLREPLPPLGGNRRTTSTASSTMNNSRSETTAKSKSSAPKKRKTPKRSTVTADIAGGYRVDYIILLTVILLVSFGVVMVFSSSYYNASLNASMQNDMFYFLKKEIKYAILGFVVMFITMHYDYHNYRDQKITNLLVYAAYWIVVFLLVMVLLKGETVNGAKRWIWGFQPSEMAKPILILVLAIFLDKGKFNVNTLKGFVLMLLVAVPFMALVVLEPNLSTTIILAVIWGGMVYIASKVYRYLYTIAGCGLAGIYYALFIADGFRSKRVAVWRDPFSDMKDTGYQVVQSLYSVASGGMFGLGLGCSRQKLGYMPEAQNDIIFAIVCEELGFFGATILLIIFMLLIWRGVRTAMKARDRFGMLIASGITIMFAVQVIINVAVVTNTMPNTGIPMPFISYGGTSLIFMMASAGILMNISKSIK